MSDPVYVPPLPIISGLRCRCPRCGEGKLFQGFLKLAKSCDRCGLDYAFAEPADGPAFFVMTGVSILVVGVYTWAAVVYRPPVWLELTILPSVLLAGCLATLRPVKGWLVASQFFHKAEEGRYESIGVHGEGGFSARRHQAPLPPA